MKRICFLPSASCPPPSASQGPQARRAGTSATPAFGLLLTADCLLHSSEAGWRGAFGRLTGGPSEVRTLDLMITRKPTTLLLSILSPVFHGLRPIRGVCFRSN